MINVPDVSYVHVFSPEIMERGNLDSVCGGVETWPAASLRGATSLWGMGQNHHPCLASLGAGFK